MLLEILCASCLIVVAYLASRGNGWQSVICSYAVVLILVMVFPHMRGLPIPVYMLTWAWLWVGLQFMVPWAVGRAVSWQWQANRVSLAVVIAG